MANPFRTRPGSILLRSSSHLLVWLYAAFLALPLYYLIVSSFKDNSQIFLRPFSLPQGEMLVTRPGNYREIEPTRFQNFSEAWTNVTLDQAMINSLMITVGAIIGTLLLCVPAAYALARSSGRFIRLMERYFSVGLLIPGFAALVPTVLLAIEVGLFQTRTFLVLAFPAGALPLSVILLTQFMRSIPRDLEEAATIDGASSLQILLRIYLPLTGPGLATVIILNFLGFWNEFLYSLVVAGINTDVRTVQVAIAGLISEGETESGVLAAGVVLSLIPVYVLYLLMQRRMETALTQGSVKG